ncbi:unnamed protein product [Meloidogyne enterolobii]|uniref:Uncharacterized protein n=1 Tax=Meloidogyne enterolobii TaxID=390850 RepID=A0ACB0ZYK7_MELEN
MCQRQMDMCQGITPPKCSGQQKETKKSKLIKQHNKDENKYRNEENEFVDIPESAQIEKVLVKESEADWSLDSGVVLEDGGTEKGKLVKGVLKQKMREEKGMKKKEEMSEDKEEGKKMKEEDEEGKKKREEEERKMEEEKREENEKRMKKRGEKEENGEGKKNKEEKKEDFKKEANSEAGQEKVVKEENKDKKELGQNVTVKNAINEENKNFNKIEHKMEKRREKIAEEEEQENGGEEEVEANNDWSLLVKGRGRRALTSLQSLPSTSSLQNHKIEVDVASPQMLVLDNEDYARIGKLKEEKTNNLIKNFEEKNIVKGNLCVGTDHLIVGILTVLGVMLAAYGAFWILEKRWKRKNVDEIFYLGGKLICR